MHKKLIAACLRCGKKQRVQKFGATTRLRSPEVVGSHDITRMCVPKK